MISGISIAANPAKLEFTVVTCHVIAALTLFDVSLTKGANSYFLIFNPFVEL
jgi:hypothetical protein